MPFTRKPTKGRIQPVGGKTPKGRKPAPSNQMRTFGKPAAKAAAPMKRQATRSKNPKVMKARAQITRPKTRPAKRMVSSPRPKAVAPRPATPKPAPATITPRKVTTGGQAIGAAHQSFFDIGKFLKSLGGGN